MISDIKDATINQLTLEAYEILGQVSNDKPGANGGYYAWFQKLITRAENENNEARALAGVIVMKAYGEEMESPDKTFYPDRLQSRINLGIRDMVLGQ